MTETQKSVLQTSGKVSILTVNEAMLTKDYIMGLKSEESRSTDIEKYLNHLKGVLKDTSYQARSSIHYYESINILIKKALENAKRKINVQEVHQTSHFGEVVAEVNQEYEEDDDDQDEFDHIPSMEPEIDPEAENSDENKLTKYWHKVQRRVLYTYAFLIAPANGIILQYLDRHGTTYCLSEDQNLEMHTARTNDEIVPITFQLTSSILKFCETLFACADKSLYNKIFTDELVLSFIRTHWICFIRLYNRSFKSVPFNTGIESPDVTPTFTKQHQTFEETQFTTKDALLILCKLHLK